MLVIHVYTCERIVEHIAKYSTCFAHFTHHLRGVNRFLYFSTHQNPTVEETLQILVEFRYFFTFCHSAYYHTKAFGFNALQEFSQAFFFSFTFYFL